MCKFNLVPTNVYATLGTDEKAGKRKNWPFEWRIEGVQPAEMRVTADAAIRYVTRMDAARGHYNATARHGADARCASGCSSEDAVSKKDDTRRSRDHLERKSDV